MGRGTPLPAPRRPTLQDFEDGRTVGRIPGRKSAGTPYQAPQLVQPQVTYGSPTGSFGPAPQPPMQPVQPMPPMQPVQPMAPPKDYDPSVHQRGFGVMEQPTQGPAQIPAGMQGDQLREQQAALDAMNQARQAGLQVGPTPNQPQNPYAGMSTEQLQQMNEQIRMQQMQADAAARNQVPWYMRPPGMDNRPNPYPSSPSRPEIQQMNQFQPYQRTNPNGMSTKMSQPYQRPRSLQSIQPMARMPANSLAALMAMMSARRPF